MAQTESSTEKPNKPYDPLEAFREMRDAYLNAMAKSMVDTVNTEGYAEATGKVLDTYLSMTSPAKEALDRSMLQALEQMSLPSRNDVLSLAERLTNVEMRIDDMDAKLDQLVQLAKRPAAPAPLPDTSVTDRLTNVEARIDTMDAKLDQLLQLAKTQPAPVAAAAPRENPVAAKAPMAQNRKR